MSVLYLEPVVDGRVLCSLRLDVPSVEPFATTLRDVQSAIGRWSSSVGCLSRKELGPQPRSPSIRSMREYVFADGKLNEPRLHRHLGALYRAEKITKFTLESAPSEPAWLVGRGDVVAAVCGAFDAGRSVYLAAPRRYGKSSLLRTLSVVWKSAGRSVIDVDLSDATTCAAAVVQVLVASMTERAVVAAVDATRLFAPMPVDAELTDVAAWEHDAVDAVRSRGAANVLERVLSLLAEQPTLLMLDEFSRFLRNTHRDDRPSLDAVLATLQRARQTEGELRMVLCGSGGLKAFSASSNLPVVDSATMETIALPALSAAHASMLLEELLYGHDRWPASTCAAAMHAALGDRAVPHFVHHLVRATLSEAAGEVVDASDVRRAYRNGLLGARGNATFREYALHKQAYPSSWLRAARGILDRLASEGEAGVDRSVVREVARELDDSQFDELLSCLDEDYDVGAQDGRVVARCKPLRDRWLLREQWLVSDR